MEIVMFDWRIRPRRGSSQYCAGHARFTRLGLCAGGLAIGILLTTPQTFFGKEPTHLVRFVSAEQSSSYLAATPGADSGSFAAVVEKVKPAVVALTARTLDDDPESPAPDRGMPRFPHGAPEGLLRFATAQGSGFFISADGYVVTNDHVVRGSTIAQARTDDGEVYKARVIGSDKASDLALLKVDGRNDFPHVQFAEKRPNVGDRIITVGNPFGLGGTVTAGIVSARSRDVSRGYQDLIQIDAPVNKGNSGGPTFNITGKVVGVNSIIFSPSGGSVGIAFAIPAEKVRSVVSQLEEKGSVTRGWLGMQYQSVSLGIAATLGMANPSGILVADVSPRGPAANAGLATGDVITTVRGEPIRDAHAFGRLLDNTPPGTALPFGILRDGKELSVIATAGSSPPDPALEQLEKASQTADANGSEKPALGLRLVAPESVGVHERGAMVTGVDPSGLAAGHGIDPGDVILDIANKVVESPDDVFQLIADAQHAGKTSVLVRIKSGAVAQFVPLPLGS
jgi:serine protease Do